MDDTSTEASMTAPGTSPPRAYRSIRFGSVSPTTFASSGYRVSSTAAPSATTCPGIEPGAALHCTVPTKHVAPEDASEPDDDDPFPIDAPASPARPTRPTRPMYDRRFRVRGSASANIISFGLVCFGNSRGGGSVGAAGSMLGYSMGLLSTAPTDSLRGGAGLAFSRIVFRFGVSYSTSIGRYPSPEDSPSAKSSIETSGGPSA